MAEREQYRVAREQWEQHEKFRRECYEKLQRIKKFLREINEEERVNYINKRIEANRT
jgi:hypothetical protein